MSTSVSRDRTTSKVTSSGPVRRRGFVESTPEPESGGHNAPSKGEVSGSGDLETRTYLVFGMEREVFVCMLCCVVISSRESLILIVHICVHD